LIQIGSAVAFLHNHEILHNDLKFDNILITGDEADPIAKLADFGHATFSYKSAKSGRLGTRL
jgi:serine/threonine protein kinase